MYQSYGRDGPRPRRRITLAIEVLIVSLLSVTVIVVLSVPFFASLAERPVMTTVHGTVAVRDITWVESSTATSGEDGQPSAGIGEPGWSTLRGGSLDEEVLTACLRTGLARVGFGHGPAERFSVPLRL